MSSLKKWALVLMINCWLFWLTAELLCLLYDKFIRHLPQR